VSCAFLYPAYVREENDGCSPVLKRDKEDFTSGKKRKQLKRKKKGKKENAPLPAFLLASGAKKEKRRLPGSLSFITGGKEGKKKVGKGEAVAEKKKKRGTGRRALSMGGGGKGFAFSIM